MKFLIILGGFLGFALVLIVGLAAGRRSPALLLEASVACVVGGMLFRWWHALLVRQVRHALVEKKAAVKAAADRPAQARAGAR